MVSKAVISFGPEKWRSGEVHFGIRKLKGSIFGSLEVIFMIFTQNWNSGPLWNDLAAWFVRRDDFYWILDVKFLRETTRGQKRSKGSIWGQFW